METDLLRDLEKQEVIMRSQAESSTIMNNEIETAAQRAHLPIERKIDLLTELEEHEVRVKRQAEAEESARARVKIQRVPNNIKFGDGQTSREHYYTPREISIGPIHAGNENLAKRDLKLQLTVRFVADSGRSKEDLIGHVKGNLGAIKKCYEESVVDPFDDDTLLSVLFLDACFVLQFIYGVVKDELKEFEIKSGLKNHIKQDIFLLENQLPFRLLQLLIKCSAKRKELAQSIYAFMEINALSPYYSFKGLSEKHLLENEYSVHLLDILRRDVLAPHGKSRPQRDAVDRPRSFRNVQDLKIAMIKIKSSTSSAFFDVSFYRLGFFGATLTVPALIVNSSTVSKLLNLVAFEMCSDNDTCDFGVSSYLHLMDSLVDTEQDVRDLRAAHVLRNHLGSDYEVATLFNDIGSNLVTTDAYNDVQEQIQQHFENPWARRRAQLIQDYFRSPWSILALIGGMLMLSFVAIITYFTVYPRQVRQM